MSAETPSDRPDRPSERAAPSGSSGEGGASGAGEAAGSASTPPPPVPPRTVVGAAGQGPRPPWWHRRRSLAAAAVLVAVVAGLAVILVERQPESSGATGSAAPEVTLQAAGDPGRDPYTPSVAVPPSGSPSASPAPSASPVAVSASAGPGGVRTVNGGSAGLYGGTEQAAGCDVAELSDFLTSHTDRGHAWAAAEGIDIGGIPEYLSTLTPVVLRVDTRVTNHGFVDGAGTGFQSVLQAGSAVLVDDRGVPRARCACGNPLLAPTTDAAAPQYAGGPWPAFDAGAVVVVQPAPAPVGSLVLVDQNTGQLFTRPVGGTGTGDRPTTAPTAPAPSSP
ncbi:DUF6777 domain-containing protein [Kitasatospora sp. GAS1066B]|uniref:DUF6777 domain-containing protein n=1 Tax=Kitasatospora sp. GAS1066B TaxID=3156271 RepID=UPI0035192632